MAFLLRDGGQASSGTAARLALVAAVLAIVALFRLNRRRPFSLGPVYAGLFLLFHVGLLVPIALGASPSLLNPLDTQWVMSDGFTSASLLVTIATSALMLGYLIGFDPRHQESRIEETAAWLRFRSAGHIGLLLLSVGCLLWVYNVLASGAAVSGSYVQFLDSTAATSMPAAYVMMGLGMPTLSAGPSASARRAGLVIFAVWSVPAFMLGLRGEVILPLAAYLVVAARRRRIPLRPWMAFAFVGGLGLGAAVRVIRQVGFGNGFDPSSFRPFDGITELGYSIRPLVVSSDLHERYLEPYVGVDTYLAPFRRFIVGRLLGGDVIAVADDPAVFGAMISRRVGPIGGSPAAEAFHAGGVIAVVVVMAIIGLLIARLDSIETTPLRNALVGTLTFVLLLWVRNDFTPVPFEAGAAVGVVLLVRVAANLRRGRRKAPPSLPPGLVRTTVGRR
ncbi:O-antigen polysaccharide polymerase Wzy [Intrasporangium flavum]|uniref:O-antigen polysaccharide polymerase Wzy n=1 Tax=Intrasporangium flavum TaxID=1428657 RepID=UPI001A97C399|nr:O-antigen polysaccharide polymerase Wzy [Intrasporangium flavum]